MTMVKPRSSSFLNFYGSESLVSYKYSCKSWVNDSDPFPLKIYTLPERQENVYNGKGIP